MPLRSQSSEDANNIYIRALAEHLDYLDNFHKERPDLIKIPDIYFIEEDYIVTENFPAEINGHKIKILTQKEIIEKVKGKNTLPLIAIRPVLWRQGKMRIHVVEFMISGNKRNIDYVNQMNGSAFFVINSSDCQGFEIERIEK